MIKLNRPKCPKPEQLKTNYRYPANKKVLAKASNYKCMYCESNVDATYAGDVEHIKPKKHYPKLKYTWKNLGYVCARCNRTKWDKYDEQCKYVDPYSEDPSSYIEPYVFLLKAKGGNARGQKTIDDIGLNRNNLSQRREETLKMLITTCEVLKLCPNVPEKQMYINQLRIQTASDQQYSLLASAILSSYGY